MGGGARALKPVMTLQEIRITVLHELAHYFGLEEDRLEELGYG